MFYIVSLLVCSFTFAVEFNFESNLIPVYKNGELLSNPFFGGYNKPKVQWIDWDLDGQDDLFLLDEDGYIRYIHNTSSPGSLSFELISANYFDLYAGGWYFLNDFDSDGDFDLITQNSDDLSQLSYYQNNSNTFTYLGVIYLNSGDEVYSDPVMTPTFTDIDNDGDLDFFTCNYAGTVTYYDNVSLNDSNIPVFEYITNYWQEIYIVGPSQRHGASAINFIDLDGDNDFDLTWGDYFQQSLYVIWNIGNQNEPNMNTDNVTLEFPPNDPVLTAGQNMPSFTDIDNDNDYDLFITVLSGAYGNQWVNNFIYYENIGNSTAPYYEYRTSDFLGSIDLMINASPELYDIDNDGDLDLFIGTMVDPSTQPWSGRIHHYENIGGVDNPIFNFVSNEFLGTDLGTDLSLSFGNVNGDAYIDVVVGNANGFINLFLGLGDMEFEYMGEDSEIDLSGASSPELFDYNGNGYDDLILGDSSGNVWFYINGWQDGNCWPNCFFSLIDDLVPTINTYTSPTVYDINNDGHFDIILGTQADNVLVYINNGSSLTNGELPFNTLASTNYSFPHLGNYTHLAMGTLTESDKLDIIAGISTGGMYHLSSDICYIGDINNDGLLDILDIVILVNFIINVTDQSSNLFCSSDINSDGIVNILDIVSLINIVLQA